MAKSAPCPDGNHDYYPAYNESGHCNEYCRWSESHCRKCGWYIGTCPCGDSEGCSKISSRAWAAIERQRKQRIEEDIRHEAWDAIYR